MVRNKVCIERQINERQYQFIVPSDAPLNECYVIVEDIKNYIVSRIKEAEEQSKESEPKQEEKSE